MPPSVILLLSIKLNQPVVHKKLKSKFIYYGLCKDKSILVNNFSLEIKNNIREMEEELGENFDIVDLPEPSKLGKKESSSFDIVDNNTPTDNYVIGKRAQIYNEANKLHKKINTTKEYYKKMKENLDCISLFNDFIIGIDTSLCIDDNFHIKWNYFNFIRDIKFITRRTLYKKYIIPKYYHKIIQKIGGLITFLPFDFKDCLFSALEINDTNFTNIYDFYRKRIYESLIKNKSEYYYLDIQIINMKEILFPPKKLLIEIKKEYTYHNNK
jgi:hypothetical protein